MLDLQAKGSGLIDVMCEGTLGGTSYKQQWKKRWCFKETVEDQDSHLYMWQVWSVNKKCTCFM